MTTRTIRGTYAGGYTLQPPTTTLIIAASGSIAGYGVRPAARGAYSVVNQGTVHAYNAQQFETSGIDTAGSVVNGSPTNIKALIEGQYAGVDAARVVNFATIISDGVEGGAGVNALVTTNGAAADTSALIVGGVAFYRLPDLALPVGTLVNFGTITAAQPGDTSLSRAVYFGGAGGVVANGDAGDTRATLAGEVDIYGTAKITNFGTIGTDSEGPRYQFAVSMGEGSITNGSAADTTATLYAGIAQGPGRASGEGVVTNYGTIINLYDAVEASTAAWTIANLGTIRSQSEYNSGHAFFSAVALDAGGQITNGSAANHTALIEGYVGVYLEGTGTLTNFGTIARDITTGHSPGDAVLFTSSSDTLVVEAGAEFIGGIEGAGGILDLASGTGTIRSITIQPAGTGENLVVSASGRTTLYTDFRVTEIGAGASSTLTGLAVIGPGDSLGLAGTLSGSGALALKGGGSATLDAGAALSVAKVGLSGAATTVEIAGRLTYAGTWTQALGALTVDAGDQLTFTGVGDRLSGTLTGAGAIAFQGGADTLETVMLSARRMVITGAAVTLSGAIDLTATLTATTPDLIVAAGGAALSGGGTLILSNAAANSLSGATATARLTNADRVLAAGALGGGQMVLDNEAGGIIEGFYSAALVIDTGARTIVNAGLIEAAGSGGVTIKSAIGNSGTLAALGGDLTVDAAVNGGGSVRISGGIADFAGPFSQNVTFGPTGELALAQSQAYAGTIAGFSKTGKTSLDLGDIAFGAATTASFSGTTASGVLTVTDGAETARIKLAGDYLHSTFTLASDGHGGTTVIDPPKAGRAPHAFIAAMAGLGGGGSVGVLQDVSTAIPPLVAAPVTA